MECVELCARVYMRAFERTRATEEGGNLRPSRSRSFLAILFRTPKSFGLIGLRGIRYRSIIE